MLDKQPVHSIRVRGAELKDAYLRYARLRGWRWAAVRIGLFVAGILVLSWLGAGLAVQIWLGIFVVDAYVRWPIREGRPVSAAGLGLRGAWAETAAGFAVGAVVMAAVIGVLSAAGWYRVRGFEPEWAEFAIVTAQFLHVGVTEEIVARGFLFRWAERWSGTYVALAFSSVVFGFMHLGNPNAGIVSSVSIAVAAGLLLGGGYILTRRLWLPIGIHWSWNLFQGPVFGARVSGIETESLLESVTRGPRLWTGGEFGPEAGLVTLALGGLTGLGFIVAAVRRGHVVGAREPEPGPGREALLPAGSESGEQRDEHLSGRDPSVPG